MSLTAAITQATNIEVAAQKRREATHCKRGHSNWGFRRNGRRYCKTCKHLHYLNNRAPKPAAGPFGLTEQEIAVVQAAADGLSVPEAAKRLHYCQASICDQRARAFRKLNVVNIAHAVAKGFRYGFIN